MNSKILLKFAKKGINLSPEAYDLIINSENPVNLSSSIIVKLKSNNYSKDDLVSVNGETIKKIMIDLGFIKEEKKIENQGLSLDSFTKPEIKNQGERELSKDEEDNNVWNENKVETTKEEPIKKENKVEETTKEEPKNEPIKKENKEKDIEPKESGYPSDFVVKIDDSNYTDEVVHKYKRNEMEVTANFDGFEILSDTSKQSYTSGEISNLIDYFQDRYNKIAKILSRRPELKLYQKIGDLTDEQTDLNLIVMITDIRTTKNGHYFLECEDDTGSIPILVSKDNFESMKEAEKLMKDEVIGIVAQRHGNGDNSLAICQNIINPGVPRMPNNPTDFATVFTSDVHIGSVTFLEDAFVRFTRWLNGDFGTEEQMELANNVKYMIVGGDIVDGIGVYPNQDKELAIKDITAQYDEAARLLGDIRSDIKIIITPGNHDASRVAEPQPAVPDKYAKSLYTLKNTEFVSNPALVNLEGMKVQIYHGRGIDDMVMGIKGFSHERNDLVMQEFLEKRHLAPLYGERTPLASELEDHLVINQVPDVLHTGHVHINTYKNYKGIHCINSGTFQTQTEFQKIYNIVPTPAEVPILYKGQYKQLKFI
ncbi:MAG: DNA-directed DNA polymerase II small subunit [Methanobacteriaceae archaeon]|nr:DNA-directed DNA polymerase II small subunit [Methanobacteriaceae archaeon]